jgi:hypothetical protein
MFSEDEIKRAVKYVGQDVSDDFWPDVNNYADLFHDIDWCKAIDWNKYQPSESSYVDVPKPTMILRPGHYLDLADRIYFQLLVNKFAEDVDSKFTPADVDFGYRISPKSSKFLHEGIQAWTKFRDKDAELFALADGSGMILNTDISAYFEHIKISKLIEILGNFNIDSAMLTKLEAALNKWSEDGIGIPQGNNCWSFLANVYLDEIDKVMTSEGYNYYRFVDDMRIYAEDEATLRQAIQRLTQLFRPLNLHLNSGKTKLIDFEQHTQDLNEHKDLMEAVNYVLFFEDFPDTLVVDDSLQEIWKDTVTQKYIDKTKFRYCVIRFKQIASEFPLEDILNHKLYDPSNIDYVTRYLSEYIDREHVQKIAIESYEGSTYEYEMIYILKLLLNALKLHFEIKRINKQEIYATNNPLLIGYYFLIASKFGTQADRALISADFNKHYRSNKIISRYYMLAFTFFPKPSVEIDKLLKTHAYLKPTAIYLAKKKYEI